MSKGFIECPYCHEPNAEKLWFLCTDQSDFVYWHDVVSIDPNDENCMCNAYVCPSCGGVVLFDAKEACDGREKA